MTQTTDRKCATDQSEKESVCRPERIIENPKDEERKVAAESSCDDH
jgi:hypothetical protein